MDSERKAAIANYYDNSMGGYRIWHGRTHALHSGFWDGDTENRHEALLNTNRFVAEIANISSSDRVLDAAKAIIANGPTERQIEHARIQDAAATSFLHFSPFAIGQTDASMVVNRSAALDGTKELKKIWGRSNREVADKLQAQAGKKLVFCAEKAANR